MKTNLIGFPVLAARTLASPRHATADHPATGSENLRLPRNKVFQLEKNSHVKSLEIKSGIIWLTGTPASGDVLLSPGERFVFSDHWPFVIQALEPSEVSWTF